VLDRHQVAATLIALRRAETTAAAGSTRAGRHRSAANEREGAGSGGNEDPPTDACEIEAKGAARGVTTREALGSLDFT
jgi:hypothetical protein